MKKQTEKTLIKSIPFLTDFCGEFLALGGCVLSGFEGQVSWRFDITKSKAIPHPAVGKLQPKMRISMV
ncbi:hypothetical protein [Gilliamella sp. ESL0254]|uniref:hypothetical protein n=1 Tax=Gilliamella sp. ESL0254 TaxID=2705035 RepID=UPI00158098AC|nr:hypothetical protein [Gilliamella sp. ESL0254]NUF27280.1 hypothetical protein [Gilliamella sp. ESL0254]